MGSGKEKGPKKRGTSPASSKEKGDVVEEVVAMMHEAPGVEVRRGVRLPAKRSGRRGRQIDVLLLGSVSDYQTVLVIECKNYGRRVDVGDVGRFRDLLEDVGLSPQQGILVAASGFSPGALERADELGMRTRELSGLTADGLRSEVHQARQLVVVAVPEMAHLALTDRVGHRVGWEELGTFYDEGGNVVGLLPDLLWFEWLKGAVPSELGDHELELEVPRGWHRLIAGRREPVISITATARVGAAVVSFPGEATSHALVDPSGPEGPRVQRRRTEASFDAQPGEHPVHHFLDEGELESFVREQEAAFTVTVGKIRAPRLRINHVYWPPSARVARRMWHLERFMRAGRLALTPENLRGVEGNDLRTLWEPIVEDYPAVEYLRQREGGRRGA